MKLQALKPIIQASNLNSVIMENLLYQIKATR